FGRSGRGPSWWPDPAGGSLVVLGVEVVRFVPRRLGEGEVEPALLAEDRVEQVGDFLPRRRGPRHWRVHRSRGGARLAGLGAAALAGLLGGHGFADVEHPFGGPAGPLALDGLFGLAGVGVLPLHDLVAAATCEDAHRLRLGQDRTALP